MERSGINNLLDNSISQDELWVIQVRGLYLLIRGVTISLYSLGYKKGFPSETLFKAKILIAFSQT